MIFKQLQCQVKHYAWGETGDAYIASLLGQEPGDKPWAELWIGVHPSASAVLLENGEELSRHCQLPFLLKVLCCSEPLSIQSHPDLSTAAMLHALLPREFPDANHKPEVLLALSPFRVMAGFRPLEDALADISRLQALSPWAKGSAPNLRELCRFILEAPAALLEKMAADCRAEADMTGDNARLFLELDAKHPADCGAFFAFLLNTFTIQPGHAIFVGPNIPHAYLCGRGVECMANSDNVIRAGLTPKYVNKKLLMDTLNFRSRTPQDMLAEAERGQGVEFDFSCSPDFRLKMVTGRQVFVSERPAVFIVLDGSLRLESQGESVVAPRGSTWYCPAIPGETLSMTPLDAQTKVAWAE